MPPTAVETRPAQQRKYRPAETKARILQTARDLFLSQGYPQTSTLEIARTAGVSEGSIFYHFGSKQNILLTLGQLFAEEKVAVMRGGETDLSKLEPGIIIARIFAHVAREGMGVLMLRLPPNGDEVVAFNAASRGAIVDFIAQCMAASCPDERSAEHVRIRASLSYSVVSDALMHLCTDGQHTDKNAILQETIRYVRAACGYGHLTDIPEISE